MADDELPAYSCHCRDPQLSAVQDLMARGVSQRDASLAVWGDPGGAAPWSVWRRWVGLYVAVAFAPLWRRVDARMCAWPIETGDDE